MTWSSSKLVLLSTLAASSVLADEPFSFCRDGQCGDCPVSVASAGAGFPECVIYNTADFFTGGKFPTADAGGFMPWLNIDQPDPKCKTIVKSPASTQVQGCGTIIAAFGNSACKNLILDTTFMVQTCCGDDCSSAGTPWKRSTPASSVSGGHYLKYANGTVIEPAERGQPDPEGAIRRSESTSLSPLRKRADCTKNSWVADPGMESYTRPADGGQIVYSGVGSEPVRIKKERSVSYTQSVSANLGFEDILSFGISMETSITETMTESMEFEFTADEGKTGDVVFTPFLRCSTGTATCEDGDLHGEVCTGYTDATGMIKGLYLVAVTT